MDEKKKLQRVFLVCGVSGSGKSWVCRQVTGKFHYVPHDLHYADHPEVLMKACGSQEKPVITECPFGERLLKEKLELMGLTVIPYFVVEAPEVVAKRYHAREGKPLPKNAFTRATTIMARAREWVAPFGKSELILKLLQEVNANG